MALTASLFFDDPAERRDADRVPVGSRATARLRSEPVDVVVLDLSCGGCLIETDAVFPDGARISLGIGGIQVRQVAVVRRTGRSYGCRFTVPLTPHEVSCAGKIETVRPGNFGPVARSEAVGTAGRVTAGLHLIVIATVWVSIGILASPLLIGQALLGGILRKPARPALPPA